MAFAILDTGVYIDEWRGRIDRGALQATRSELIVRQSAVVLSELRRGARTRNARRLVETLYGLATVIWEPTAADWWEAGELIREIGDERDWETNKRRGFQNDALIALTARRHGAAVVTTNARDFGPIASRLRIRVISVS